ncbi:hypothetical protein N6B72_04880 [Chryseobacterium soli]|uniref:hypothetical protein n=1 Tax=Chryseobacterium soli TaxID=445961 RepID=UPI002954E374|nr:hypothetical protein [Chryseobacterium soli]MDV7696252.1 hypothetical protein [Chryseobacterium soli]
MKDDRELLLKEAIELINKHSVTAYEISMNTDLSDVGVQKIINGDTKRPLLTTLKAITSYIKEKYENSTFIQGSYSMKTKINPSNVESFEDFSVDDKLNSIYNLAYGKLNMQEKNILFLQKKVEKQDQLISKQTEKIDELIKLLRKQLK